MKKPSKKINFIHGKMWSTTRLSALLNISAEFQALFVHFRCLNADQKESKKYHNYIFFTWFTKILSTRNKEKLFFTKGKKEVLLSGTIRINSYILPRVRGVLCLYFIKIGKSKTKHNLVLMGQCTLAELSDK